MDGPGLAECGGPRLPKLVGGSRSSERELHSRPSSGIADGPAKARLRALTSQD